MPGMQWYNPSFHTFINKESRTDGTSQKLICPPGVHPGGTPCNAQSFINPRLQILALNQSLVEAYDVILQRKYKAANLIC